MLAGMGVLTLADGDAVTAYCVANGQFVMATEEVNRSGLVTESYRGGLARNPALLIQSQALNEMARWGSALGLSPVARMRLVVEPNQEGPGADILQLLTRGHSED
jgi:P27 family predicted phage terminase small subunit